MRYVIVRAVGTGITGDSFRAPFPTYELVAGPIAGLLLVRVDERDYLDDDGNPIVPGVTQKLSAWLAARGVPQARIDEAVARYGDPDVTVAVSPAALTKWRNGIKRRYKERAADYDFDIG